jgi:hypothetical protein
LQLVFGSPNGIQSNWRSFSAIGWPLDDLVNYWSWKRFLVRVRPERFGDSLLGALAEEPEVIMNVLVNKNPLAEKRGLLRWLHCFSFLDFVSFPCGLVDIHLAQMDLSKDVVYLLDKLELCLQLFFRVCLGSQFENSLLF